MESIQSDPPVDIPVNMKKSMTVAATMATMDLERRRASSRSYARLHSNFDKGNLKKWVYFDDNSLRISGILHILYDGFEFGWLVWLAYNNANVENHKLM